MNRSINHPVKLRRKIQIESMFSRLPNKVNKKKLKEFLKHILLRESVENYFINLICVDKDYTIMLNIKYLGKNHSTDVIAFPLSEGNEKTLEGEVYINIDQAKIQADENNCPHFEEIYRLAAHGILHLCGYDDLSPEKKNAMFEKQEKYISFI